MTTVEKKYQKLSQREHALRMPDVYIGSVNMVTESTPVVVDGAIQFRDVTHVPGLCKLFDEIIVNARDHRVRDPSVRHIKVEVQGNRVSVFNDGSGIEVVRHQEHDMYVPELIFGNLLTSANYDQEEDKIVGGKNGLGSKLVNIFSKEFRVETVDATVGKKYVQTWRNNMADVDRPKVTSTSAKPFTRITFTPDFSRFGMEAMTDDVVAVLEKRVHDLAATTPQDVTVSWNGKALKIKSFAAYVDMWLGSKAQSPRVLEKINDRWEVGVTVSPHGRFRQVSFVNGICTTAGGRHVDHVVTQIVKKLVDVIAKRKRKDVKPSHIKDNMWVFVNAVVVNPAFTSQGKEQLSTSVPLFGSRCDLSDAFVDKLYKCGLVDRALEMLMKSEDKSMSKTDGAKRVSLRGYPKLEDAIRAGTKDSHRCTLIICEGDSAKAFAVAGLSVVGREFYGVVPIRGKPLNVKDATPQQLTTNVEFNMLKTVLGLKHGVEYDSASTLRYGAVLILTDSDVDGSHIKGLLINFIYHFWPSLITRVDGFVKSMLTPIVKATRGRTTISFYTLSEYNAWKGAGSHKGFTVRYFKGLGTSTSNEAKEYFRELHSSQVVYTADGEVDDSIKLAFDRKLADKRKRWLMEYDPEVYLEQTQKRVAITDFVNKDFIHFSCHDNVRSIPSVVDGFKPSQRKVLYGCVKRLSKKEMKVAQLSGAVAEVSAYHSGEASLQGTIISMAQDFVGSNNVNLLQPKGQFGSRLGGGKDAASPRYIFTELSDITKAIFKDADAELLEYLNDDGFPIEPRYYVPVLPMVLVNGASGIGTGFSTNVPCYKPHDVIANILKLMDGEEMSTMQPWYRGFTGTITENGGSYVTHGVYEIVDDHTVRVTELPIGRWVDDYKALLEQMVVDPGETSAKGKKPFIATYTNHSTEATVDFHIRMSPAVLTERATNLEADLRLTTTINAKNMHLFSPRGVITKYASISDIITCFYGVRLDFYGRRKQHMMCTVRRELDILGNRVRFLKEIANEDVVIYRKSEKEVHNLLACRKYKQLTTSEASDPSYSYLSDMKINSFTQEKMALLEAEMARKTRTLQDIESCTEKDLWKHDLESVLSML